MLITQAQIVLHLHVRIPAENQPAFWEYVRDAFPVFEKAGDCKGAVYAALDDPERFDEVFYYRDEAAYEAGERALSEDPVQVELLKRWRALLAEPPRVEAFGRRV